MAENETCGGSTAAKDWSWTEPTEEEFERLRKEKNHYRIYKMSGDREVNVYKFWAKDDSEALAVLNAYKADHPLDVGEYYYSNSGYIVGSDGKRHDSFRDCLGRPSHWERFIYALKGPIWRLGDAWFWLKTVWDFARTGHSRAEAWSLDTHVIEDICHNVPIMIANLHGCPTRFCLKAREKIKTEPSEGNE